MLAAIQVFVAENLTSGQRYGLVLGLVAVGLPMTLCSYFILHRGFKYQSHYIERARRIEGFLPPRERVARMTREIAKPPEEWAEALNRRGWHRLGKWFKEHKWGGVEQLMKRTLALFVVFYVVFFFWVIRLWCVDAPAANAVSQQASAPASRVVILAGHVMITAEEGAHQAASTAEDAQSPPRLPEVRATHGH